MKNKPTRHKETNTFKFQSFSDRISHLDVDVFHRIGHKNEEYNEEETFLHQTLQKWNTLNLSESYDELRKELPAVQTLPLLLNQREVVIEVLLKHLSKRNSLALEAILDLLAAVMKDLRHEVYSSYSVILRTLCELLSTKNADELEWTFTCLAYMFKYLWRYIVKDIGSVFDNLVPLFSDRKPEYVRNFAAESFAYVTRKVKNKKEFVKLIIKTLESRPDSVEGCGRLMFEVVKGIHGGFHSSAQDFLSLILEMLYDDSVNSKLLYEMLKYMVSAMCSVIETKYISVFWNSIFGIIMKYHQREEENIESLLLILKLVKLTVNYKNCILLNEPRFVIPNLLKLLENVEQESISRILSEIVAAILLSPNIHLLQENAQQLTSKVLMLPYEQTVLDFICQILLYPGFETFILPWIQMYVCKEIQRNFVSTFSTNETNLNETVLKLLPLVVLQKGAPSMNGINLESWKKYPLDLTIPSKGNFNKRVCVFETLFLERYNTFSFQRDNIDELMSMLLVLPHVNLIQEDDVCDNLKKMTTKLCLILCNYSNYNVTNENELQKLLFLFHILLEAQIHLMDFQNVEDVCSIEFMVDYILPMAKEPTFISTLCTVDLYLTAMKLETRDKNFRLQLMKKVCDPLLENLSSPYHKIRFLTTHILSLFVISDLENELCFVKTCFEVETVSVSIHNVRGKLFLLEKLSYDLIKADDYYQEVPLRFLLGILYENFQLLWEPVIRLVTSYARGMALPRFWRVFKAQLELAAQNINKKEQALGSCCSFSNTCLIELYNRMNDFNDRPDYSNYRILLWKSLAEFSGICEMKNRDVSPLFLNFLEKEYLERNSQDIQVCSVKLCQFVNNEDHNSELIEESLNESRQNDSGTTRAQLYKTLVAHIKVFAKLRSPKNVFREPELTAHYFNLLTHKNSTVQKMALDCLMAYKEAYLVPYREHLYGLLDDNMFKKEISVFHIDQENSVVQNEHRTELLPVLIRILYGRMLTKTGRGTTGKGAAKLRRSLVLRFLSGCQDNEMILFLKLAFKTYCIYLCDNTKLMVEKITKNVDLNHVISLKCLRSSLNLLLMVMEKFGALMGNDVLLFVLQLLICLGCYILSILAHKNEIHAKYTSGLRSLQTTSILAATKFFSQFTDYPWDPEDLEVFFSVFVWPGLEKLPIEGIHSPTALLKLLASWSRNPRYFNLFIKSKDGDSSTPLSAVMKLLAASKIKPSVSSTIMEMLENLLTTIDSEDDTSELKLFNCCEKLSGDLNYGSKIILPHVPVIIEHFQRKLLVRNKKGLNSRDLLILSRVCELVVDTETSESLLKLLFLTFLKKVNGSEETVMHLVSTIYNLMKNVSAPFKYLRCIAPLFGTVSSVGARKMLCALLTELVKGNESNDSISENVQLLLDINAWDVKWVEQPDFNRRLEGFKSSYEMIEKENLRLDFGLILVHNCFYFLKCEKDLALRDSSSYCLRKLSPYLCKQATLVKNFHVPETILKLISVGIREKSNENLHDEAITLLGELVRESSDSHPTLLDLKELTCKEDPEVDFFNNIIHLQSHRRARALMRFCSVAKQMTKPPRIQTLTQFILPLVSSFLCSEKYLRKVNVVDAGVLSIGMVCKFLPWFHYETILKYYLRKLHSLPVFQKQLVRVIVSILDGFHFDVSLATEIHKVKRDEKLNMPINEGRLVQEEKRKIFEESNEVIQKYDSENQKLDSMKLRSQEDGEIIQGKATSVSSVNNENEEENVDDSKLSLEEEMENAMDNISDDEKIENDVKEMSCLPSEAAFILHHTKLSKTSATRVIQSIVKGLLPMLQQTINVKRKSGQVHKVNRKKTAAEQEEEDTMCIPVALAIVKLLQQLPKQYLDQYLPNIFLIICNYLKSRLESVRRVAREMLQKIMASLGPSYLGILLNEMIALLTKGYQIHVLIFTIHSVLSSMKSTFKPGDIDACLRQILEICQMDLFGRASEEKNVQKITGKVSEARSHKSYDTLKIAAQFITEKCFVDLLLPFKEVLASTNSFSLVTRVSECLHQIVIGFNDNTFVSIESLLIFVYGVASSSIDAFKMNSEQKTNDKDQKSTLVKQPDSFLILPAPRTRSGAITVKPRVSSDRNAHVLVEFSFRLLRILLKRGKATDGAFAIYIDPLVPILQNNIDTPHVKLMTTTLHCFVNILKMDLPNLRQNINVISTSLFNLLHKYATAGLPQGQYQDMVIAAFKVMTVLVRDVKYYVINDLQLKALLLYVENDMQNFTKQSTAFPLLKAILSRKLDVPEVYEVMIKVAKLSIVSDHDLVRSQARLVFYHFLMNYPLGKKVDEHINFYVSQLSYELEPGRLSAFQIIHRIISTFPENALSKYSGILFVAIGAALINDDRPNCKKMAAKCLKTLITRDEKNRDKLFSVTLTWLKEQKITHRTLGAQVCGIFVEVETDSFLRHMQDLLPVVQNQLSAKTNFMYAAGKSVRLVEESNEREEVKEKKLRLEDHSVYQMLRLVKKVCSLCPSFLSDSCWMSSVKSLGDAAQHLLGHPHEWIRLEAAAVLGHIFASLDIPALVETVISSSHIEGQLLFSEPGEKLKSLILDFCAQLVPNSVGPQLIEQVTKNLAFLSRVLQAFPEDVKLPEENGVKISLLWMIRRMRKIVNMEIVQTPYLYTLREAVFKWIGALVVDLNRERLQSVITQILAPLARELLNEEESNPDILQLARGVSKIIKKKLGIEEYTSQLSKLQMHMSTRRAVRKRDRAMEFIHNPEMAAKRKIRKQQKKKIVKKRKMDEWKGRVAPKIKRKFNKTADSEHSSLKKKWVITEVATNA